MNIRRAGRKVVKNLHKEYGIYRIGFVNIMVKKMKQNWTP